jgi:hypothetical protein
LKPLELGADYADAADIVGAYEYAFNLVDDAFGEAIKQLKIHRFNKSSPLADRYL